MQERETALDFSALVSHRAKSIDASGVRRIFELAGKLDNPIDLSLGQPDFPVPREIKDAVIDAIENDCNCYTVTQGCPEVLEHLRQQIEEDIGWDKDDDSHSAILTAGTSGALVLIALALLDGGDEMIIPDPYFVLYPKLGPLSGGTVVCCDTYPDFRMTAERVEPLITDRTKVLLFSNPSNPTGVVLDSRELGDLATLCRDRGIVLVSDEIYDEFTYTDALEDGKCPSAARLWDQVLMIRGMGKTYGCTGWRIGYAAGPTPLIEQMSKLQQFTFVCAPSMAQRAFLALPHVNMSDEVASYLSRRNLVVDRLRTETDLVEPHGAFYAFVEVPKHLGLTASEFAERAVERGVLIVPGNVFSSQDTHFRLSYAVAEEQLERGLDILVDLMRG